MGKTNWMRVFLGGLLAGVVMIVLGWITWAIYLGKLWGSGLEALGHPLSATTAGDFIAVIVLILISGILAVWLYSAIRPRYGAGVKTAVIAGLIFWILNSLFVDISLGGFGLFSTSMLLVDTITSLIVIVVGTLIGAWYYKEQSQ